MSDYPRLDSVGLTRLVNGLATKIKANSRANNISYTNTTSHLDSTNVQAAIDEIAEDFQDGCDVLVSAVTAKGQTPASNSPADIAEAISHISGGSIPTITRDNWNALTPAEKQAQGLIIIVDSNTGYKRGDYVNGADYYIFKLEQEYLCTCTMTPDSQNPDTKMIFEVDATDYATGMIIEINPDITISSLTFNIISGSVEYGRCYKDATFPTVTTQGYRRIDYTRNSTRTWTNFDTSTMNFHIATLGRGQHTYSFSLEITL